MANKSYRELVANRRYLRGYSLGPEEMDEERVEAENDAAAQIDAVLGKTFSTTSTPAVIRLVADLLGSANLLDYVAFAKDFGADGEVTYKSGFLRTKAQAILDDLRAHKLGILNPDGTWDSLYPAADVLPFAALGEAKPVTIVPWLSWGQMAQPKGTEEERSALDGDTRERYSDPLEAALAGAYGI